MELHISQLVVDVADALLKREVVVTRREHAE
jgi:hypothetical protein